MNDLPLGHVLTIPPTPASYSQSTTPQTPLAATACSLSSGTIASLAADLASAGATTAAQIQRERLTSEWKTKRQPTKLQAAPAGLFEQTQGRLFS